MITFEGVRREAEARRRYENRPAKIRSLTKSDFTSYESLEKATGVDFKKSDDAARRLGVLEEDLVFYLLKTED